MKTKPSIPVLKNNRRNFLKSQVIFALGATMPGIAFSEAHAGSAKPSSEPVWSANNMREKYQQCLGGPFPDQVPMNVQIREIIH